jgi:hypothetical protein
MAAEQSMFVATKSLAAEVDGHSFVLEKDVTLLAADHPLVEAKPDLFKQVSGPRSRRRAA